MRIKALVSFSGALSMRQGEEKDINDKFILEDLLKAGYIEELKKQVEELKRAPDSPKVAVTTETIAETKGEKDKDVKPDESKRNNSK